MLLTTKSVDFLSAELDDVFNSENKLHCIENLYADKRQILNGWTPSKYNNLLKKMEEDKGIFYINKDIENLLLYHLLKKELISIIGEQELQLLNSNYDEYFAKLNKQN